MAFSEISSKVVESAISLTEEKLKISVELLKVSYDKKVALEEVVKNYTYAFNAIKNISPPEQTARGIKRHFKILLLLIGIFICFLSILSYYIFVKYNIYIENIFSKIIY